MIVPFMTYIYIIHDTLVIEHVGIYRNPHKSEAELCNTQVVRLQHCVI